MRPRQPDYLIFALVIVLSLFGLVMVFSASFYTFEVKANSTGLTQLLKQCRMVILGLGVMIATMLIPYSFYSRWHYKGIAILPALAVLFSWALLALVLFTAEDKNGAKRWLEIAGMSVQPSEIGRFAMILFVADEFARKRDDLVQRKSLARFFKAFTPSLAVAGGTCALILLGSNLSMTAATGLTFLCMCIVVGINWRFISLMCVGALAMGAFFTVTKSYRMARVAIFTDPFKDPMGDGYQLVQSLYALGAGGLTGVGLGNSTQKYLYLIYSESDFIFGIIGEELGFLGIVALLSVYSVLILRGLHCARDARDTAGMMLATGIISTIALQLLINVAVCTSSMPPTGLPLPFISSGGSSMLIFMAETGVLLNVSRYRRPV